MLDVKYGEGLMESDPTYQEAINRFIENFDRASKSSLREAAAVALATVDAEGRPSARMVLLRCVDQRGFVFFTNSRSSKGEQLAANSQAALCFHWDPLREQVRVEGSTEQVSDEESDTYWEDRPRDSQLSAWASLQSQLLADRSLLEARLKKFEQEFADREIPRPEHWYGYRIVPRRIEFWQEGSSRLHHRTLYERGDAGWARSALYP